MKTIISIAICISAIVTASTANAQSINFSSSIDASSMSVSARMSFADDLLLGDQVISLELTGTLSSPAGMSMLVTVEHKYAGMTVTEILKKKKGSIKQAPLPAGSPSWDDIKDRGINKFRICIRFGMIVSQH